MTKITYATFVIANATKSYELACGQGYKNFMESKSPSKTEKVNAKQLGQSPSEGRT